MNFYAARGLFGSVAALVASATAGCASQPVQPPQQAQHSAGESVYGTPGAADRFASQQPPHPAGESPAVTVVQEPIGRYQLHELKEGPVVLDSETGSCWVFEHNHDDAGRTLPGYGWYSLGRPVGATTQPYWARP